MRFGLCTISNTEWPVRDVIELAAEEGYDGVEIWGRDHVQSSSDSPDLDACRAIAELATNVGIDVPVYGSYLRAGTTGFRERFEAALALNVDLLRVWAGEQEYADHDPAHWEAVVADLEFAGQRAERRGLEITVEKHEGTVTDHAEGARRLIRSIESPAVGLNWQPLFALDAQAIHEEAEELAPVSNNIHLQAVPEQGGDQRCLLSEAYFDVASILQTFEHSGYEGYVEVEFVDPTMEYREAVRADREYLHEARP